MNNRLTKSFLLALAVLCFCEVVVRVFFVRNMSGRFEYGYHPTAGIVETADGGVNFVRAGGRRFHPQSFTARRPEGVFRIMVVGDSVPRGPSLQASYAAQLGEMLRAKGVKAESFNLAVGGFGARRNQLVLKQALRFQPSLIVLHVNNSNEYEDEREWRRAKEFQSWHPKNWLMKSLVIRRLHEMKTEKAFWGWLPAGIRNQKAVNDADAEVLASMDEARLREWDKLVAKTTAENVALCRQAGVPLILLTQARFERNKVGSERCVDHGLDALIEPLAGRETLFLSMKQAFASQPLESVFSDSSHLKKEGHEALARAIADLLERERMLPATK